MARTGLSAQFMDSGKSRLSVLVIGKTGVGKSALINSLANKSVSRESAFDACTRKVKEITVTLENGIQVTVFDSPGLYDCKGRDEKYMADMRYFCRDVDLILYCTSMDETRITQEDIDTICIFTREFGPDFWENTVIVFTFANKVIPPINSNDPEYKKQFFLEKKWRLAKKIQEVLQEEACIPASIVEDIPIVPAGYHAKDAEKLPDGTYWMSNLWLSCLCCITSSGRPALIKGCLSRFEVENEGERRDIARRTTSPPPSYSFCDTRLSYKTHSCAPQRHSQLHTCRSRSGVDSYIDSESLNYPSAPRYTDGIRYSCSHPPVYDLHMGYSTTSTPAKYHGASGEKCGPLVPYNPRKPQERGLLQPCDNAQPFYPMQIIITNDMMERAGHKSHYKPEGVGEKVGGFIGRLIETGLTKGFKFAKKLWNLI